MLLISFGLSIIQEEAIKTSFRIKSETTYKELILGLLLMVVIASSFNLVNSTTQFLAANIIPPNTNYEYQDSVSRVIEKLTDEKLYPDTPHSKSAEALWNNPNRKFGFDK